MAHKILSIRILTGLLLFGVISIQCQSTVNKVNSLQITRYTFNGTINAEKLRQDGEDAAEGVGEIAEAAAGAEGFTMIAPVLGQMITGLFTGNFAQIIRAVPMTILDNSAAQAGVQVILNAVAQPVQNFVQYTIRQGQMFYNVTIQRRRQQAQAAAAAAAAAQSARSPTTLPPAAPVSNTVRLDIVPGRVLNVLRIHNTTLIRQESEDEGNNFEEVGDAVGNLLTHVLSGNLGNAIGSVDKLVQEEDTREGVASILNPLVNPVQSLILFTLKKGQQYFNITMQGTPSSNATATPTNQKRTPSPIVITVEQLNNPPALVEIPPAATTPSSGEDDDDDELRLNSTFIGKYLKRRLFYSM